MISCSQPECQTTAGCKCNVRISYPISELLAAKDTELAALRERVKELEAHNRRLGQGGAERYWEVRWRDEVARAETAERKLAEARGGLTAAIRAAKLAVFTINKQGVMPNSSWESGFNADLKTAEDADALLR